MTDSVKCRAEINRKEKCNLTIVGCMIDGIEQMDQRSLYRVEFLVGRLVGIESVRRRYVGEQLGNIVQV